MRTLTAMLITLFCTAAACQEVEDTSRLIEKLGSGEREYVEEIRQTTLAFMPLDVMFQDESLRRLARAAGNGDIRRIDSLVAEGVDVNARGTRNATVLFWALRSGNEKGFRRLLELEADPNVVYGDGGTVMHWAARMRDSTFLRLALEFGGDPDLVHGDQETTPIFDAIVQDDQRNLMLLIEFGADIDARMKTGLTPILSAALGNRYDMVYALLINGADYTIRDDYGFDLAHYVEESRSLIDKGTVRWLQYQEVVDQLQNLGVDIPE